MKTTKEEANVRKMKGKKETKEGKRRRKEADEGSQQRKSRREESL